MNKGNVIKETFGSKDDKYINLAKFKHLNEPSPYKEIKEKKLFDIEMMNYGPNEQNKEDKTNLMKALM